MHPVLKQKLPEILDEIKDGNVKIVGKIKIDCRGILKFVLTLIYNLSEDIKIYWKSLEFIEELFIKPCCNILQEADQCFKSVLTLDLNNVLFLTFRRIQWEWNQIFSLMFICFVPYD